MANADLDLQVIEPSEPQGKSRRRRKRATATKEELAANYSHQSTKFFQLMVKSQLSQRQRMREVEGIVLDVALAPTTLPLIEAMKAASKDYDATVKKEGKGHKRGPPCLYSYLAALKLVATSEA